MLVKGPLERNKRHFFAGSPSFIFPAGAKDYLCFILYALKLLILTRRQICMDAICHRRLAFMRYLFPTIKLANLENHDVSMHYYL